MPGAVAPLLGDTTAAVLGNCDEGPGAVAAAALEGDATEEAAVAATEESGAGLVVGEDAADPAPPAAGIADGMLAG